MLSPSDSPLSGCKRLRLSYIVDMPGDEDKPSLWDLCESANDFLDKMRKRGIPESTLTKMVEKSFDSDDVEGLKTLLASLRKKVDTHDAGQAAAVQGSAALHLPPRLQQRV